MTMRLRRTRHPSRWFFSIAATTHRFDEASGLPGRRSPPFGLGSGSKEAAGAPSLYAKSRSM